jgi:hypothetical protein
MPEVEHHVQPDSAHRNPVVQDDFKIPTLDLEPKGHHALIVEANVVSRADRVKTMVPVPSQAQIVKARIQFISLYWTLFLAGWNDASTGPLLPRIQNVYQVFSILWGGGGLIRASALKLGGVCYGFVSFRWSWHSKFTLTTSRIFLVLMHLVSGIHIKGLGECTTIQETGFGESRWFHLQDMRVLMRISLVPCHRFVPNIQRSKGSNSKSGSLLQSMAYALQAAALPFPIFVVCFAINGFGLAIQVSLVSQSSGVQNYIIL